MTSTVIIHYIATFELWNDRFYRRTSKTLKEYNIVYYSMII